MNPITNNGIQIIADTGDMVCYGSKEFIFNNIAWQEFGGMGSLNSLEFLIMRVHLIYQKVFL